MNKVCSCFLSFRGRRLLRRRRIRPRLLRGMLVASVAAEGEKREKGGFDGPIARIKKSLSCVCLCGKSRSRCTQSEMELIVSRNGSARARTIRFGNNWQGDFCSYAGEVFATFGRKTKSGWSIFCTVIVQYRSARPNALERVVKLIADP